MARKNKHYYDPKSMKSLEGIALPEKIKCARCCKNVSQKKFSSTQLSHARLAISEKGVHAEYSIKCQSCIDGGVVEIKCIACSKTKGLEEFARSQRRNPDNATCYDCVEAQLAVDPINEDVYESNDKSALFYPDDVAFERQPSQWTGGSAIEGSENGTWTQDDDEDGGIKLSSELQSKLSIKSSLQRGTLIQTDDGPQSDDFGWQTASASSWYSSSKKTPSSTMSGSNVNKYGKPSTGTSNSSLHTFDSGYVEKPGNTSINKSGFAKIKAYNPKTDGSSPVSQPPQASKARADEHDWSSSESDGDYDSDEDAVI
ncbi:hypothetical protein DM02DRAFT_656602 [Periconia macrospinosa]|uniref:Stc1 domain-containing protein n=1 Tax=Periconia macrospinosa TaxID=97972 RepID=A0A2V1DMJ8_9PLEO|nr:hypothetical protein DM02DRAFT_656602 [Periconia macrospinosa]